MTATRRNFLRSAALGTLPALLPNLSVAAEPGQEPGRQLQQKPVRLFGDGELLEPGDYLRELAQLEQAGGIGRDRYGVGGSVEALEKKMADLTGKEKAVFLPSGTMANQLAIALLSGEKAKVFVQDLSHVFRDEADAAQTVFRKRLMPLGRDATCFTAAELRNAIERLSEEEVFESGIGAVSIENPVRRADGKMVPIEEISAISTYCREKKIPLHLDGARLFMASAWSGHSVAEYSGYFDTVYISLYKYLGASAGAILCGKKELIDQVPHSIKVHGGSMYANWSNAAMALHRLDGFEKRLLDAKDRAERLFVLLQKQSGVQVQALLQGTNIYLLSLPGKLDGVKFQEIMGSKYQIRIPRPNATAQVQITVNETLLFRTLEELHLAFTDSIKLAVTK